MFPAWSIVLLIASAMRYAAPVEDVEQMFMTEVITLYNESIFYHLEPDSNKPGALIAALDNALSVVDVNKKRATAYVGQPDIRGYKEDFGTRARFHTAISFTQISNDQLIVVDKNNYCLRSVNRTTGETSMYVANCMTGKSSDVSYNNVTSDELRLESPTSVVFDRSSNSIFLSDNMVVYRIEHGSSRAFIHTTSPQPLTSILLGETVATITGVIEHQIVRLFSSKSQRIPTILTGSQISGDRDGTLNMTLLSHPKIIIQYQSQLYLVTDNLNNKLRMVDTEKNNVVSLCSGVDGYTNGNMRDCQLLQPYGLTMVDDTIFVGERGTYGGGIRQIQFAETYERLEKRQEGVALLVVICLLMGTALLFVTVARCHTIKLENLTPTALAAAIRTRAAGNTHEKDTEDDEKVSDDEVVLNMSDTVMENVRSSEIEQELITEPDTNKQSTNQLDIVKEEEQWKDNREEVQ